MAQLHLLDATYELFRAHFARAAREKPDGRPFGATTRLLESVFDLVRGGDVTHLGCATDHVIRSWRNERYAGYKTEAGVPAELLDQFPLAEEALRAAGFVVWPMVEFEADDAIGAAAARWIASPEVERIVILSPDKDMTQCVREDGRIVVYDRRKRAFMDADGVRAKFGVGPESIPDYLALVGDSSDGYPGLPAWGATGTAAVLRRYAHLEGIPERAADWEVRPPQAMYMAAVLRERWDDALLFRELATLRTDAPVTESLDDLRWDGVPRDTFQPFVERLGAERLLERVPRWADGSA